MENTTLRFATCLVAALIALSYAATPASAQDGGEGAAESDASQARLDRSTLQTLRRAARRLDLNVRRLPDAPDTQSRTATELARRLSAKRYPDRVFDWMRENIGYEPYDGAMRGARGTLISRRGNAVDQAILAHTIFAEAGVDARFAVGTAPDEAWKKLAKRLLGEKNLQTDEGVEVTSTMRGWKDLQPSSHVWLEVKIGDKFKAFDPILSTRYGETDATASTRSVDLPERLRGRFELKVFSRLQDGQEQVVNRLTGRLTDLMGDPITLGFKPAVGREHHVEPVLRVGDKKSDGSRIPTDVLERLELQFVIEAGGRGYRMSKLLYLHEATPELFDFDQQVYAIAVLPGWVSAHFARGLISTRLDAMADEIDDWTVDRMRASDRQSGIQFRADTESFMANLASTLPILYAYAADKTPLATADALGVLPVMATPRVIVTGLLRRGPNYTVDYWRDGGEIDAVGADSLPRSLVSGLAAISGFDDEQTAAELFDELTDDRSMGTPRVFDLARSQNIPFGTLHSQNASRIDKLDVAPAYRKLLHDHVVEDGNLILAPRKRVEMGSQAHFGWWSIAPSNNQFRAPAPVTYGQADGGSSTRDADIAGMIRVGMNVESVLASLLEESDEPERVCQAASGASDLSRAFCAEKQLQSLPSLEQCLAQGSDSGGLINFAGSVSVGSGSAGEKSPQLHCNAEAQRTRCGLVVAQSVLSGELRITEASVDATKKNAAEGDAEEDAETPEATPAFCQ